MSLNKTLLSQRAAGLTPLSVGRLAATARERGAVDLASGVPLGNPPEAVLAAATAAMRAGHNQYAPGAGSPQLRAVVAERLRRDRAAVVDPEHEVTITSGATEGVLAALLTCVDPGDEVLVPEPWFESYPGAVRLVGAVPRPVPLTSDGWRLDIDVVRAAITPRTRAILLNTPHNPTGRVFSAAETAALMEVCVRQDIVCITDEVYDNFVFGRCEMTSPLDLPSAREHVIAVGSFSKSLQMSGWRLGYCVASPALTAGLRRVVERTTVCAPTPLQEGAAAVSTASSGAENFRSTREAMVERLAGAGMEVSPPEGGWFVFARIDRVTPLPAGEFATRLLDEAGVLVAPGSAFFADPRDGDRWIRTSFVRDFEIMDQGMKRLENYLRPAAW
ncbi:aspartate/methionine/tyrosine aminotransferase [Streptomyces aurantiacus]|uniref:pyridoxal phosphate-dependent aminotransferase n=1 Tax=Streptomyces aurantiacus TaxID=47760 RepID=UPI0027933D10|nr:pyridoxal phosphate-dependent aminotransferase [Streptomyces aurantiacus]MDQ0774009.1 aspartate/methionine/tyrosine aminotransferase [Streptomyces aurantiacus]